MKRSIRFLLIVALLVLPTAAFGQDAPPPDTGGGGLSGTAPTEGGETGEATEGEAAPENREYAPPQELSTWLGFRGVDLVGSTRALEYGWPHSSVAGGLKLNYSPLPTRLDVDLDWLNLYDYSATVMLAYKDIIKLDYGGWALWHNLDHFRPLPASLRDDRNPTADYAVSIRDNRLSLRLKWPDEPYHLFTDFRVYEKEGTIQQRFLTFFPVPDTKNSESRDIDWITRQYRAGMNGHFGPVELEYDHRIKTFDPHGDVVLRDSYFGGSPQVHNAVPQLVTNMDTLKIHSDLTGRIAASGTASIGEKDNDYSGAHANFVRANGDITIIPLPHVTVAVRYRYRQLEEAVPAGPFTTATGAPATPDRPINRTTNDADLSVRYNPVNAFSVKLKYEFENTQRQNAGNFADLAVVPFQVIPEEQNRHIVSLGAALRPSRGVDLKGGLEYSYTDDPAYPISPKNSVKGKFEAGWTPTAAINAQAYYRFARENNHSTDMYAEKDNAGTIVTWAPTQRLSCFATYDFSRMHDETEIRLRDGTTDFSENGGNEFPLFGHVPYNDMSHLYALGAGYIVSIPLSLNAELHQSWSFGRFRTDVGPTSLDTNNITTSGVGELTDLKIRETGGSVTARYTLPKGWATSLTYSVNNFEDMKDKPQNGPQDGTAHTVLVMLSKKW